MKLFLLMISCLISAAACGVTPALTGSAAMVQPSAEFNAWWNAGKAELARYELRQVRYGATHSGEMIVITVTEPFRTDKQVKSELSPGVNETPVLKVQQMRRFATGIYDYALTTTSFRSLYGNEWPQALKVSGSAVDWCGHAWLQLNLRGKNFAVESRSYFEDPGDESFSLPAAVTEDEIWQLIRMDPQKLPVGRVRFIPSFFSSRLRHRRLVVTEAVAELQNYSRLKQAEYSLVYAAGSPEERQVSFVFESSFPHRILEYREKYLDAIGAQGARAPLTTTARLKKTIMSAYWQQHDPQHRKNRREFGVRGFE